MLNQQDMLQIANKLYSQFKESKETALFGCKIVSVFYDAIYRNEQSMTLDAMGFKNTREAIEDIISDNPHLNVISLGSNLIIPIRAVILSEGANDIYGFIQTPEDQEIRVSDLLYGVYQDYTTGEIIELLNAPLYKEVYDSTGTRQMVSVDLNKFSLQSKIESMMQNATVMELFETTTDLLRRGELTAASLIDNVKVNFNGLKDEGYRVFKDLCAALKSGPQGVLSYIKAYYDTIKTGVKSEDGWSFQTDRYVTSSFDFGIVLNTLSTILDALAVLLLGVSRIAALISAALSGVLKIIKWAIKKDWDDDVNVIVNDDSPNFNLINPVLQMEITNDFLGKPSDFMDKYIHIVKRSPALKFISPGIEGWIWPSAKISSSGEMMIDSIKLEAFPSLRWNIDKLFVNLLTRQIDDGHNRWIIPSINTIERWCDENISLPDTTDNDELAHRYLCSTILYLMCMFNTSRTSYASMPRDWVYPNAYDVERKLRKLIDLALNILDPSQPQYAIQTDYGSIFSILTDWAPSFSILLDDWKTSVSNKWCFQDIHGDLRYGYWLDNCLTIKHFNEPSTEDGVYVLASDNEHPENKGCDVFEVVDHGDAKYIPPKFTKSAKIMGYVISAVVIATVAYVTVKYSIKLKRFMNAQQAKYAADAESAWSDYTKDGNPEDYKRYVKSVRANNMMAKLTGGTSLSRQGYWASTDDSESLTEKMSSRVKEKLSENSGEDIEASNHADISLLEIKKLLKSN